MKKLFISLKIHVYVMLLSFADFFESLIERLNGRSSDLDIHSPVITRTYQNSKLRVAIRKIVREIYDENGKLRDKYKTSETDLTNITELDSSSLTLTQRLERARLLKKVISNPTDESGTEEAMVMHNVKNAHKYVAAQKKRELMKQLKQSIINDDLASVKELRKEIHTLNLEINRERN